MMYVSCDCAAWRVRRVFSEGKMSARIDSIYSGCTTGASRRVSMQCKQRSGTNYVQRT